MYVWYAVHDPRLSCVTCTSKSNNKDRNILNFNSFMTHAWIYVNIQYSLFKTGILTILVEFRRLYLYGYIIDSLLDLCVAGLDCEDLTCYSYWLRTAVLNFSLLLEQTNKSLSDSNLLLNVRIVRVFAWSLLVVL